MRWCRGAVVAAIVGTLTFIGGPAQADTIHPFTNIKNNDINANANYIDCVPVTDVGDIVYDLLIDQPLLDLMTSTLAGGGHLYVYWSTHGAASTPEGSSGDFNVRVLLSLVHPNNHVKLLGALSDIRSAPPGFSTDTNYGPELGQAAVNVMGVGDKLRVRAYGRGTADPGECGFADNPIVTFGLGGAGAPYLYVNNNPPT